VPFVSDEMLEKAARGEEHVRMIRELGILSFMIVPLRSRGEVVGTITFVASDRRFSQHDLTQRGASFTLELPVSEAAPVQD